MSVNKIRKHYIIEWKKTMELPKEFKACVEFHGHSCPGLAYGYIVVKEAMRLLDLKRSHDEEVVAICENDSCAVDAFQVLLGTTIGKGNLIIKDYGKNAYTILDRSSKRMYRFSRTHFYNYTGKNKEEFQLLERALSAGKASSEQKRRQKLLKTKDLIKKPFDEVFSTRAKQFTQPPYAPIALSKPCSKCGEMTMATKLVFAKGQAELCIPCSDTNGS